MQEEYIKEEQRSLKRELLRAQEEVKRIQAVPLVIGQFLEMIDRNSGIIGSTTGSNYYVRILSTLNRELLKPSSSVALHRHSNALVDILPPEADSSISLLSQSERPDVTYQVCQLHTAHTQQLTCMQPVSPSTRASCASASHSVRIDNVVIVELSCEVHCLEASGNCALGMNACAAGMWQHSFTHSLLLFIPLLMCDTSSHFKAILCLAFRILEAMTFRNKRSRRQWSSP